MVVELQVPEATSSIAGCSLIAQRRMNAEVWNPYPGIVRAPEAGPDEWQDGTAANMGALHTLYGISNRDLCVNCHFCPLMKAVQ